MGCGPAHRRRPPKPPLTSGARSPRAAQSSPPGIRAQCSQAGAMGARTPCGAGTWAWVAQRAQPVWTDSPARAECEGPPPTLVTRTAPTPCCVPRPGPGPTGTSRSAQSQPHEAGRSPGLSTQKRGEWGQNSPGVQRGDPTRPWKQRLQSGSEDTGTRAQAQNGAQLKAEHRLYTPSAPAAGGPEPWSPWPPA